jgi:LPXTG-motif cell wall-anchored protein
MKNPFSLILIIVGLLLGIYGIVQLGDSGKSVEVAGIELGVKDKGQSNQAYMFIGLGALSLIGGIIIARRK